MYILDSLTTFNVILVGPLEKPISQEAAYMPPPKALPSPCPILTPLMISNINYCGNGGASGTAASLTTADKFGSWAVIPVGNTSPV